MRLMDMARVVRSKNAGPLHLTFDIMLETEADYERCLAAPGLRAEPIAKIYSVSANAVVITPYPTALAIRSRCRAMKPPVRPEIGTYTARSNMRHCWRLRYERRRPPARTFRGQP